jgi:hypothetical protein
MMQASDNNALTRLFKSMPSVPLTDQGKAFSLDTAASV